MRHSWKDEHIKHSGKSLLKALYTTLGIFLFLFVAFHIGSSFYASYISDNIKSKFNIGIFEDTNHLKQQGDEVAKNSLVINSLLNSDRKPLIDLLRVEKTTRSIGLMGVANSQGVMVGRTLSRGKYGDNVFLIAPAGRRVSQGKSVQSIELTGFNNEIFMTTARPILQNGSMVGALFANYLLDDKYATIFQEKYLGTGSQVVFYTKKYGVYGNSFTDQNTRKLISSYFNTGSTWIKDGASGKTIVFEDGTSYLVENIVFPGLDESPGGALIFVPRIDISNTANLVTAILTLLIFLFIALRLHLKLSKEERGWRYYVMLIGASVPVFFLSFFALYSQNIGRVEMRHIPYTLYNSTIRLQPEFGIYDTGTEQSINVIVDTGDEPINAVQVSLKFDPSSVKIESIDTSSSTCSYVIQSTIDQVAGTINMSCVILNPNEGQQSIPIATINARPLSTGTFTLSFNEEETKVIAADGIGTNVLRLSQNGSYQVDNFNTSLDENGTSTATSTERSFVLFSFTHPNEARWYNTKEASFIWRGKANSIYRYVFDSTPNTEPTNEHVVQGNQVSLPIPGDGIYYFHLQLVSGGPVAHYKIRSDMNPPNILSLKASQDHIFKGDVVRFSFDASDTISGIQKNYYVDLGNRLFLPIGQELFVPFMESGYQDVKLRVYDNAGNYSEKNLTIDVADR